MNTKLKIITPSPPSGIFDRILAYEFCQQIDESIASNINNILVNLEKINFIDSAGLGALLSAYKIINQNGGKFMVCSINQQIKILFELVGIDQILNTFSNPEEVTKIYKIEN